MIKRPLNPQFSDAVREGRKSTTIRDNPWPVGVPIMLYNWSGLPYRSKQIDVAPVIVESVHRIVITRFNDTGMGYGDYCPLPSHRQLWETEGFDSREQMNEWFRSALKKSTVSEKVLMRFSLLNISAQTPRREQTSDPIESHE
jgi:hypothetical protein